MAEDQVVGYSYGRRAGRPPRSHFRTKYRQYTIEALGTIEPTGPFERALARLLMAAYKRRLRAIVKVVPTWVSEEILSASEHIREDRAVLWLSEN
jgi:hypothetical protein